MTNEQFNEMLTIEGMLQVVDASSGVATDVRQMLAIKHEDIKNESLRESIKKCDLLESVLSLKNADQSISSVKSVQIEEIKMGEYLEKLDYIEVDVEKGIETIGEEEKTNARERKWSAWWDTKQDQNNKLKEAILANDFKQVQTLLHDEGLSS